MLLRILLGAYMPIFSFVLLFSNLLPIYSTGLQCVIHRLNGNPRIRTVKRENGFIIGHNVIVKHSEYYIRNVYKWQVYIQPLKWI